MGYGASKTPFSSEIRNSEACLRDIGSTEYLDPLEHLCCLSTPIKFGVSKREFYCTHVLYSNNNNSASAKQNSNIDTFSINTHHVNKL